MEFILVIAVVIRGRFCYYKNRMLMLVNWQEGSDITWVNIYPPVIASSMEMKRASDQMWRLLKRRARKFLVAELKSLGKSNSFDIFTSSVKLLGINC